MAQTTILALGDSLTEGYHAYGRLFHPYTTKLETLLISNGTKYEIHNYGISGDKTSGMLDRLPSYLSNHKYQLAIVLGGTNDLSSKTPDKIFANIASIHSKLHATGCKSFAVTVPEVCFEAESDYKLFREDLNNRIRQYCQAENVGLIDLAIKLPYFSMDATERKLIWDDGIHFTPAGYDRIAEIIYDEIKKFI